MVELIDLQTVKINGVEAGSYDAAYLNNPNYQGELWTALQTYVNDITSQRDSLAVQLNDCVANSTP